MLEKAGVRGKGYWNQRSVTAFPVAAILHPSAGLPDPEPPKLSVWHIAKQRLLKGVAPSFPALSHHCSALSMPFCSLLPGSWKLKLGGSLEGDREMVMADVLVSAKTLVEPSQSHTLKSIHSARTQL